MCETGFAPEYTFRSLVLSLIRCEPCKCRTGDMQAVLFPDAQSLPFSEPPAAIVHQPISINHSLAIMKNPIKYLPFSFTVLSLFSCAEKTAQKPNVLFISVDDLNDWVGALGGHPQAITPNMDRLFQKGVLFTNAHAAQPVSTASRNSLLSGLHPCTTGWYASTESYRKNYDEVMQGNMMMPEYFKENGYETLACGKVFHNGDCDFPGKKDQFWTETSPKFWNQMEAHIEDAGYGYRGHMFYPFPAGGGQLVEAYGEDTIVNYYQKVNRFYSLCGGPLEDSQIPSKGMFDEQIAAWAVNKIKEKHGKPFFLAVGFLRPHVPYTAPKRYFDMYDPDSLIMPDIPTDEMKDIPMCGKTLAFGSSPRGDWYDIQQVKGAHRELVHAYLACITFVDEQIGKVIKALEESGQMDNTIIVLYGDHGQHLGEKHHFRKQALWEESTRVPLFFRIPGAMDEGKSSHTPVSLLDIYPTLLKACQLPANEKNQGTDLSPIIRDVSIRREKPVLISWYYKNFAVRSEHWRYIRYRDGSEELYDHRNDPGEHINLASDARYDDIREWHRNYIPTEVALPSGSTVWEGDKMEQLYKLWSETDSVPTWLR